jgi:hypothetical protein
VSGDRSVGEHVYTDPTTGKVVARVKAYEKPLSEEEERLKSVQALEYHALDVLRECQRGIEQLKAQARAGKSWDDRELQRLKRGYAEAQASYKSARATRERLENDWRARQIAEAEWDAGHGTQMAHLKAQVASCEREILRLERQRVKSADTSRWLLAQHEARAAYLAQLATLDPDTFDEKARAAKADVLSLKRRLGLA